MGNISQVKSTVLLVVVVVSHAVPDHLSRGGICTAPAPADAAVVFCFTIPSATVAASALRVSVSDVVTAGVVNSSATVMLWVTPPMTAGM